jgi:predicted nucleic acid-binding protein
VKDLCAAGLSRPANGGGRSSTSLKRNVPVHPVTEATAEIIGRISGEQAAKGIKISFDDLAIGAAALEHGYAVATLNLRHFRMIPGLVVKSL